MDPTVKLIALLTLHVTGSLGVITVEQTPQTISVETGGTVKILCRFSQDIGNYMNLYQLKPGQPPKLLIYLSNSLFSGTPGHFSGSYSGADHTFTISGVQREDEAEYHCGHRYSTPYMFGQGTKLIVKSGDPSPPEVKILHPTKTDASPGVPAPLVCVVSKFYPDHVTVEWLVDGQVAKGDKQNSQSVRASDRTFSMSSTLQLSPADWEAAKSFTCRVQHEAKPQPTAATLHKSQCQ
ncbi:hypothetical protein ACEWY4_020369 [Coilia grayii]|uniref:Ig-like domain-containing protein n=1 Tax=Coilia grayii TaxID=363190 RepID=A0ABD1JCE8_9TELE